MENLVIYDYHPETFEYLGKSFADPNPLEEGNWLIPAHATTIPPIDIKEKEVPVFNRNKQKWSAQIDLRGTKYWTENGIENVIKSIGETIPENVLLEKPEEDVDDPEVIERRWRDRELAVTDRCFTPDWGPTNWTDKERQPALEEILLYRRELKDGPITIEIFPETEWRPIWPKNAPRPTGF